MATLSENEAKDIVKDMLPIIRKKMAIPSNNGRAIIRIIDIEDAFDPVKREGNTSDVFCKIAGAAFEHGMAADIDAAKYEGMVITFKPAEPKYKNPSPEICKTRWGKVKKSWEYLRSRYGEANL